MYQPTKSRGKLSIIPKEPQMLGLTFQPVTTTGSGGSIEKFQKQQRDGIRPREMLSATSLVQRPPNTDLSPNIHSSDRPQSQPLRSSGFGSGSNTVNQTPPRTAGSLGLGVSLGRSAISSSPVHVYDLMHVSENTRYGNAVFVALPGDPANISNSNGRPVVILRSPEEKSANPDRLNLDRRQLTSCPVLEGEEHLRLLNYQHNLIGQIDNLQQLTRLIYLDLYDNRITHISGLDSLRALRVLMLGKNRISKIENLDELTKLDVLDLHGNEISCIENLNHLTELRVLNLACNKIEQVNNLQGMDALAEVNLRRNNIHIVIDLDTLPCLQRLFLSYNEISSFEDIFCLTDNRSLLEISLDGNPFALDPLYRQTVIRHMTQLKHFDMKKVTDEERRYATVIARKEEEKKREQSKVAVLKEKRKVAIANVQRQWELMQQSSVRTRNQRMPDLVASHVGTIANSELRLDDFVEETNTGRSRPTSATSQFSDVSKQSSTSRPAILQPVTLTTEKKSSGPFNKQQQLTSLQPMPAVPAVAASSSLNQSHHVCEIVGEVLNLFGDGALEAFDKNWGLQAAGVVTNIHFKFLDFDYISRTIHKIRVRFPNVQTITFGSTNIHSLSQINALSAIRRLDNIVIESDGNPITQLSSWRPYTIFRLAHFSLKKINYIEVSSADIINAEKYYGQLAHLTSQLPKSRLSILLGDKRKILLEDKNKSSQLLSAETRLADKPLTDTRLVDKSIEPTTRAVLNYSPPEVLSTELRQKRAAFTKQHVQDLAAQAILCNKKQAEMRLMWPQIITSLITDNVTNMWNFNDYMKKCLENVDKSTF